MLNQTKKVYLAVIFYKIEKSKEKHNYPIYEYVIETKLRIEID